ncbi:MAG: hypothetical protein AB7H77_10730 [Bdellovibrionales bacterium]
MRRTSKLAAVLLMGFLAACISGRPEQDSYTSTSTGETMLIQSDREMCESACNSEYSRCMDTHAASQPIPGMPQGMFGATGECRDELANCLPGCKSR